MLVSSMPVSCLIGAAHVQLSTEMSKKLDVSLLSSRKDTVSYSELY